MATAMRLKPTPLDATQLAEMTALQMARAGRGDGDYGRQVKLNDKKLGELLQRLHQSGLLDRVDGRWALTTGGLANLKALEALW